MRHVADSLIETSISRDVLLLTRVDKPALLRQLFELACRYSGQVLSYTRMLGQLQDAGNTTTLAHYLELLAGAGMVCGLPKYAGDVARSRSSSPKLQVLNTALMTVAAGITLEAARRLTAIEVKSGRAPQVHSGTAAFTEACKPQRSLLVGGDGIALQAFLAQPVTHWVSA